MDEEEECRGSEYVRNEEWEMSTGDAKVKGEWKRSIERLLIAHPQLQSCLIKADNDDSCP